MKTTKRFICAFIALLMLFSLSITALASSEEPSGEVDYTTLSLASAEWTLDEQNGLWALTGISYCLYPTSDVQYLNIFVPADYMTEDGQFTENVVNGYTAETAPIILANDIGGYAQSTPSSASNAKEYISRGYVVVSPGTRGRDTVNEDGEYIGTGCAALVDLKAVVRFIKYNDAYIAGDTGRIVSIGKSAGGAMSALLGTTGNNAAYTSYLEEIGAIMTETDDVYAAQCYCPITDLDHENISYEWFYHDSLSYATEISSPAADTSVIAGYLNEYQQALSDDLAEMFVEYVNGLGFVDESGAELTLDGLRDGTYYAYVLSKLESSLEDYLLETYTVDGILDTDAVDSYIAELNAEGEWVTVEYAEDDASNSVKVTMASLADYTAVVKARVAAVPAFDDSTYSDACGALFAGIDGTLTHYDANLAGLITSGKYEGLEGYDSALAENYENFTESDVDLVNPITMLEGSDVASYFRIRTGTDDFASSFVEALNLALAIENISDAEVDQAYAWGQPHGEAEINTEDLYDWIDQICQPN